MPPLLPRIRREDKGRGARWMVALDERARAETTVPWPFPYNARGEGAPVRDGFRIADTDCHQRQLARSSGTIRRGFGLTA